MKGYAPGWWVRCTTCGWTAPAEEIGMIRVGAASVGKRVRATCEACEQRRWLAVLKAESKEDLPAFAASSVDDPLSSKRRVWLKVVPVAILGILLFLSVLFGSLQWYFNQHALTVQATQVVANSPQAQELLGSAPQVGGFINGSVRNNTARLDMPVRGTKAQGRLHVSGHYEERRWVLDSCQLVLDGQSPGIELTPGEPVAP